jgi:hypothetical protein
MLVLPLASILIEALAEPRALDLWHLTGKWFVFWAIGIRLFLAGLKQIFQPAFTARNIFNIKDRAAFSIVKELGFSNVCIGLGGILSLFFPDWLIPAAFIGGLYYGLAGALHLTKKSDSLNEKIALVTDIFIFLVAATAVVHHILER